MGGTKGEKGFAIFWALIMIVTLATVGAGLFLLSIKEMHVEKAQRTKVRRFEGADNGIFAVAGWMAYYRDANVPDEVLETESYRAYVTRIAETTRIPEGFSDRWRGFVAKIVSRDTSGKKEIEALVFIPQHKLPE